MNNAIKSRKQAVIKRRQLSEIKSAPIGWEGPHLEAWLKGDVRDNHGKIQKFKTFEEAIKAAEANEECGGIVKIKTGYRLRCGTDIQTDKPQYNCQAVWVKNQEHILEGPLPPTPIPSEVGETIEVSLEDPNTPFDTVVPSFKPKTYGKHNKEYCAKSQAYLMPDMVAQAK